MVVYNDHFLIDPDAAVVHLTHADAAHVFVIVDGADQNLGACVGISLRRGNVINNGVKERGHVFSLDGKLCGGRAGFCRGIDEGTVKLFVVGVQIHKKLQHFIHNLNGPCFGPVAFVDADDYGKI